MTHLLPGDPRLDRYTGVVHYVDHEYDTGDLVLRCGKSMAFLRHARPKHKREGVTCIQCLAAEVHDPWR